MKILVLGADGMLGHQLVASFRDRHEVAGTVRKGVTAYAHLAGSLPRRVFDSVDSRNFDSIEEVLCSFAPDAVVNAIGIVKQRQEAKDAVESIVVNSLLPHRLSEFCQARSVRFVHLSTDCVYSGRQGMYEDDAVHDARDMYGRSKSLGEVGGVGSITLRTSIIGLELSRKASLVEWFLAQEGEIKGFTKAIYSGFTTLEIARVIEGLLVRPGDISGIYNVSSHPIDKFSLLAMLNERLGRPVSIVPDDKFECDRSLDSSRFRTEFGYEPPSWERMIDELVDQIRSRQKGLA
ncbi:SDR family oxidoreductase [Arenimonas sp.]|uniref:dTDP-4-dehydrorhamnose reductase family protein n=1 Tax=Arenimonas sp. TaxID=1872635 RepID=UPI002E3649E8|nr:SDR family oxidoreductase [Arenimonas sp.]HEX4854378.1 SDR family oxidoreductase [Arenimonas sp.]